VVVTLPRRRIVNTCFTIFELLGDVLISWLPLYYEAKIVFIVFLTVPNFRVRFAARFSRSRFVAVLCHSSVCDLACGASSVHRACRRCRTRRARRRRTPSFDRTYICASRTSTRWWARRVKLPSVACSTRAPAAPRSSQSARATSRRWYVRCLSVCRPDVPQPCVWMRVIAPMRCNVGMRRPFSMRSSVPLRLWPCHDVTRCTRMGSLSPPLLWAPCRLHYCGLPVASTVVGSLSPPLLWTPCRLHCCGLPVASIVVADRNGGSSSSQRRACVAAAAHRRRGDGVADSSVPRCR
jgi:hypothetical protein